MVAMVPTPESLYFPPLQKCLSGEALLISWKTACIALCDPESCEKNQIILESFLSEPQVLQLLTRPFNPFAFTTSQTKTVFESITAAIHVTPNTSAPYNIGEIKEDALWLSKEAQIDEVSALRIFVLEYQQRASAQLQGNFSDEESASLREAAGNISTESSNLVSHTLLKDDGSDKRSTGCGSMDSRRLTGLRIYLSERQHLLKCTEVIAHTSLRKSLLQDHQNGKGKTVEDDEAWPERVGEKFLTLLEESGQGLVAFLIYCAKATKANIERMVAGSGWFKTDGGRQDVELEWLSSQITEAIHTLNIIFLFLDYQKDSRTSVLLLEWFKFVAAYGFFDQFDPPDPSLQPLILSMQSLVALVSLAMLDPYTTLERIGEAQDLTAPRAMDTSYIHEIQTIAELHDIFLDAAQGQSSIASPAVLAWATVLLKIRQVSLIRKENRDTQHGEQATDEVDEDASPDEQRNSHANQGASSRRRSSNQNGPPLLPSIYEEALEGIMDTSLDEDPIEFPAKKAVNECQVFDILTKLAVTSGSWTGSNLTRILGARIRISILDLIRCSVGLVQYAPELVTAALAALTGGQEHWSLLESQPQHIDDDPIATFLQDPYLVDSLLTPARFRYPFESGPFLQIIRAVASCYVQSDDGAPIAIEILEKMTRFTFALPPNFGDYETASEEENTNTVQLTKDFILFESRSKYLKNRRGIANEQAQDSAQVASNVYIPAGTTGRIISDSDIGPRVVIWFFEFSGLKYMGKLLETALTSCDNVDGTTGEPTDREHLTDIVSLMATLLLTSTKVDRANGGTADSNGTAHRLLEEASDGLDRSRDIVSVVFSIFEEELQRQSIGPIADSSLDLLIATIQFIHALIPILPGRVWPLMGRCGLLDQDGRAGRLTSILTSIELVTAQYNFLISCVHLLDALIEDSVVHAVLRYSGSKSVVRFGSAEDLNTGVPDHILSKTLLSFTRTLAGVFESSCNWRYANPKQRLILSELISKIFNNILQNTYGIGDGETTESKVTRALTPSAKHILETFLSTNSGPLRFQPILRGLLDGFATPDSTLELLPLRSWISQVDGILQFTTILIRVGTLLERPTSQLEHQLFSVSPLIARLYAVHECYRRPVVALLEALILSASNSSGEPPSLLGYLGQQTSKNFLQTLSDLGKPLDDDSLVIPIWGLLSAVVGNRQRWLALYLITGTKPRDDIHKSTTGQAVSLTKSVLNMALDALSNLQLVPKLRALAMLEFVSLAQNHWQWAMISSQSLPKFITAASDYVDKIEPVLSSSPERSIKGAYNCRIAAYIAEITAMYLYHSRQMGNVAPAKDLMSKVGFYTRHAVSMPSYNSSLHGNLKRNFEARYKGCSLGEFQHSRLTIQPPGRDFFYDTKLSNKILCFDQAWNGRRKDGLAEEMALANVNLSLVDAQVALLQGWKLLAIELSTNQSTEPVLQETMVKTIKDCLVTNTRPHPTEQVFSRLMQTRADLALILLQRLVESKCSTTGIRELLKTVWDTIQSLDMTFEMALSSGDAVYYRCLLKMLFLTLRANAGSETSETKPTAPEKSQSGFPKLQTTVSTTQTVLDIVEHIVARGFGDLAAMIHEKPDAASPQDIALITAILQACLRVPGIELCHNQIISSMAASNAARVATTLFSWSDKLAIEGDPIYGELSILFLLELSSMPAMAEQLAVEGTLGHLSAASITNYLRRNNVTALADGAGLQRCYSIWARGILPLLLNMLDAVGAPIALEVALFLNQFPNLLSQSTVSFESSDEVLRTSVNSQNRYVTYSTISEVHSLSLLTFILSTFRTSLTGISDIPDVAWDASTVLEGTEFWLGSRQVLREKIVPLGQQEVDLAKRTPLNKADGCLSRLEEKIVEELRGIADVLAAE